VEHFVLAKLTNIEKLTMFSSELRIHLILMRMRILDPQWSKTDPDPNHENFFKIFGFFNKSFFSVFN